MRRRCTVQTSVPDKRIENHTDIISAQKCSIELYTSKNTHKHAEYKEAQGGHVRSEEGKIFI